MDFIAQLTRFKKARYETDPSETRTDYAKLIQDSVQVPTPYAADPTKKIALLFLIIDEFPYESIWRRWMKNHRESIDVLFHAKYPKRVSSKWVKHRLIFSTLRPEWGSVDLLKAQLLLIKEALKYVSPRFVCFFSESCLPMIECGRLVDMELKESIVCVRQEAENGYVESGQFNPLEVFLPRECIAKADQWCVLTYKDACDLIAAESVALPLFYRVHCSDEMYVATVFTILGKTCTKCRSTFSKWLEQTDKSPAYLEVSDLQSCIEEQKSQKYFFARKFKIDSNTVYEILKDNQIII